MYKHRQFQLTEVTLVYKKENTQNTKNSQALSLLSHILNIFKGALSGLRQFLAQLKAH